MSFSSEVKEELESKTDTARHCQIAEFAALMAFGGRIRRNSGKNMQVEFSTENELVSRVYQEMLLKVFGIKEQEILLDIEGRTNRIYNIIIKKPEYVAKILMTLKWCDEQFNHVQPVFVDARLIQKECCKRAFIRGAFLAAGSISDPNKFYHYEIVCEYEEDAQIMKDMLCFFKLDAKVIGRKRSYVVYMKEGSNITDVLNIMGAFVAQMNLYNVMILKGMRNDVNRKVNCETANLNKTIEAAVKQIKDIEYIRDTIGLDELKDNLREVAYIRLENPDMNLKDIGKMLEPEVGKSGVNHRLRRISEIAEELRAERKDL
ncbi:MAG: DNA-binding protein WhiA [Eubacteriales bacterium]|nr:DNA-binding protein WhiA [Eubacteriales bacterium]